MIKVRHALLAFAGVLLVAGCAKTDRDLPNGIKADLARYPDAAFLEQGLHARYAGATTLDYSTQHGTQIEYLSPDGKTYLWYPGNRALVVGRWRTETGQRTGSGRICFKYPSRSFNPATKTFGGSWSCRRAADFIWGEEEYVRGDPLRLSSGQLPYILPKGKRLTFEQVGRKLGIVIETSL